MMKNQRAAVRRLAGLGGALELSSHRVVIRLPNPELFHLVVRTAILALVLLSFPWIKSPPSILHHHRRSDDNDNASNFLADLRRLGLLKADGRSVFLGDAGSLHPVLISNRVEPVEKSAIADSTVDFLFFGGGVDFDLADRVLKTGGILAVRLSLGDEKFVSSPNYEIVHTSRYDSAAFAAVRRISIKKKEMKSSRKLLESRKQALSGLEDAVLEPPRKKKYRQKTRYLPDLLGGSQLADYPRRVFVDVGPAGRGGSEGWFEKHYPKKKLEFEVIRIEEGAGAEEAGGMNEWARRNLREEEYVVMKAEAEVVEEMVKGGTIGLVDELFLECKNQWWVRGKSKRAYWECLALYGRLKDEGVAVHQWWD